jgi:hypothetical protein
MVQSRESVWNRVMSISSRGAHNSAPPCRQAERTIFYELSGTFSFLESRQKFTLGASLYFLRLAWIGSVKALTTGLPLIVLQTMRLYPLMDFTRKVNRIR